MATPTAYPAPSSASNAPRAYLLEEIPHVDHAIVRFWNLVDKSAGPTGCWPYLGRRKKPHPKKGKHGYGYFDLQSSRVDYDHSLPRTVQAHRFSFLIEWGFLPEDLFVLHTCHNPPCVNPAHLKLGTHADNMADVSAADRWPTGDNHYTVLRPETIRHGDKVPSATITTRTVLQMHYARHVLGYSMYAIAHVFKKSDECIWHIFHDTWQHLPPNAHLSLSANAIASIPPKPPRKPHGHMTREQAKEVLRLVKTTNMTHQEIAQMFGVVRHTVTMIAMRRQWKCLDEEEVID